jgi:hypothetical protein
MKHAAQHPLTVVAPWWKWGDPPSTQVGRASRPVLQKYDSSALITQFLENPQRCFKFGVKDLVHVIEPLPAIDPVPSQPVRFSDTTYALADPEVRKLFLDTHKRFYLVVCQVNCDAPGFPKVSRDRICQSGFVVRRRTLEVPPEATLEASRALRDLRAARTQRAKLEAAWSSLRGPAPGKTALRLTDAKRQAISERRASVQARIATERERLVAIAQKFEIQSHVEGWFPSPTGADRVGFWDAVEEAPLELGEEMVFPMYPLHAPPDRPEHSGQYGTIYFGLLPTGSREVDDAGAPRFNSETLYEVRCFVKSHETKHARGAACPCPSSLVWSLPTQPYRLAAAMDLVGTCQQPTTITLPSIDELAAQAGPIMGARFVKPPGSLMVQGKRDGTVDSHSRSSIGEICFIPIPLITIVAMFVFELFLPVIMLLFGLFWMLKLKFCIPPQIEVAAGFELELEINGELGVDMKLQVQGNIETAFGVQPASRFNSEFPIDLNNPEALTSDLSEALVVGWEDPDPPDPPDPPQIGFDPIALGNLAVDADAAGKAATGILSVSAGLEWEKEVKYQ